MTSFGWTSLIVSVGFLVILVVRCFYRMFASPPEDHALGPPDSLGG